MTTQEFNKLISEYFIAIVAQLNLANKNDMAALVWEADFDEKLTNI